VVEETHEVGGGGPVGAARGDIHTQVVLSSNASELGQRVDFRNINLNDIE